MSRLFRPSSVLRFPKVLTKVPTGQVIKIERVRLRHRRRLRLVTFAIKTVLIYQFFEICVAGPLVKVLENQELMESMPEEEEAVDIFIPFPLTTERHEPQPYSGKDPEWREFVRLSKDKERLDQIRRDTVQMVCDAAEKNPALTWKVGKDMKVRRYWMDIDFPYRAPPVYTRKGLLITDEVIAIAETEVESATVKLLERVLWPKPMALSTWALGKALVGRQFSSVAQFFGFEGDSSTHPPDRPVSAGPLPLPTNHSSDVQKALERIRAQATKRPEDVNDPRSISPTPNTPPGPSRDKPISIPNRPPAEHNGNPEKFVGQEKVQSLVGLKPWEEFMKTYTKVWKPIRPDPPRGCFAVSGLVEIETSRGYLVIDVLSWYNPKTRSHDRKSMWMSVRRMQYKQQAPMRP
ncbi:hypothetical protein QC764_100640 [Podospora pseudoanserina]|uniref:Uncharacterized protein n=1 Tax=Podospora pseudoanserina TaxID=2609844 RepID=A0ABR0IKH0_9PEZI|nr:hypothetical protein QC764_100640 [Podospora pseudoanserina]